MITYDDFAKLDLRIGKVIEVTVHPNADKLYLLKVDIGEKIIQLVAGIRAFYSPEALMNKLAVILVNLEPREIRGCVSEGMLLAASSAERISVVGPCEEIAVGSKVK
jgi:methionyl-tRNA synthetase